MKTLIKILILNLTVFTGYSQVKPTTKLIYEDLFLNKSKSLEQNLKLYKSDKISIVNFLGKPDKIVRMPWENEPDNIDAYSYTKNLIYLDIDKDKLWGYEIFGKDLFVSYHGLAIKVGDPISKLKDAFSISYNNRFPNIIVIDLLLGGKKASEYTLNFEYNESTNFITSIKIESY